MKSKKKNRYLLLFILGVFIMLAPQVVIFYNNLSQQNQIKQYQDAVTDLDENQIQQFFIEASSINNNNNNIAADTDSENYSETTGIPVADTDSVTHHSVLSDPFTNQMTSGGNQPSLIAEDDVFAYIEIPRIGETLPIYLGATTSNLAKGVAQVTESSLPTGESGTHSVIAGHRGYYGATFFRYIDQLEKGDLFYIHVLDKVLTYEVTGQAIIEPDDTSSLGIVTGEDLVTLLTCTPYPTNRYRLLVYGSRVNGATESQGYVSSTEAPFIGEVTAEDAKTIQVSPEDDEEQVLDGATHEENTISSVDENEIHQSSEKSPTAPSENNVVQIFQSESVVSSSAYNLKLLNRLIIIVGLLSIAVSIGLIVKNRK